MTNNTQTPAKKAGTTKLILIAVAFFGIGLIAAYAISSMNKGGTTTTEKGETAETVVQGQNNHSQGGTPNESSSKSRGNALGVVVPTFQFTSDVQMYMKDVLNAPIPTDYKLPQSILDQPDYDAAVNQVGDNYPMFKNKEGAELVAAVQEHPYLYQELIREARATREKYFPGSQAKIPS